MAEMKGHNTSIQKSIAVLEQRLSSIASDTDHVRDNQGSISQKLIEVADIVAENKKSLSLGTAMGNIEETVIVSQQNSIKCIESEMSMLSDTCTNSFEHLFKQITTLQQEAHALSSRPHASPSHKTATDSHDKFLQSIAAKLDLLCCDDELRPSSNSAPNPQSTASSSQQPSTEIQHNQKTITDLHPDFINEDAATNIVQFLKSSDFKSENGHSVCSFGVPYTYNGSKSSSNTPPMPTILQPLIDEINKLQEKEFYDLYPEMKQQNQPAPLINSCLANKYEGANSFLPRHADNEVTIHPESSIFTLSLGESCNITFVETASGEESEVTCHNRALIT